MSLYFLGIDVAKAKLDCTLRLPNGKSRAKVVPNSPEGFSQLTAWLDSKDARDTHVCMEATGAYSLPLADFLSAQGFHVSVVNPAQVAAFGKSELSRTKTDKADAKLIARFCLALRPEAWTPPPAEIRELQALLRRLESLQEMQRLEQNREDTAAPAVAASI